MSYYINSRRLVQLGLVLPRTSNSIGTNAVPYIPSRVCSDDGAIENQGVHDADEGGRVRVTPEG